MPSAGRLRPRYFLRQGPEQSSGAWATSFYAAHWGIITIIWAMVNTHYMVDGHPIHNKDPYNGYYKSLWTIGWLAPINDY